jgi:hypothetical protein
MTGKPEPTGESIQVTVPPLDVIVLELLLDEPAFRVRA